MRFSRHVWILAALALPSSSAWAGVDIEVREGRLLLKATDQTELKKECEGIRAYSELIRERNGLPQVEFPCEARPGQTELEISDLLPRPIWERTARKTIPVTLPDGKVFQQHLQDQYDGVCYNAALVHSGILDLSSYATVLQAIEHFTGMTNITVEKKGNKLEVDLKPVSHPPYVKQLINIQTSIQDPDAATKKISQIISKSFSPGSIICINGDKFEDSTLFKEMMRKLPPDASVTLEGKRYRMDFSRLRRLKKPKVIENRGPHCLAMITPSIVIETNLRQNHILRTTDKMLSEMYVFARLSSPSIALTYVQMDPVKLKEWVKSDAIFREGSDFSALLDVTRKRHEAYESTDDPAERTKRLAEFFRNEGLPVLGEKRFDRYRRLFDAHLADPDKNSPNNSVIYAKLLKDPAMALWFNLMLDSKAILEKGGSQFADYN